MSIEPSWPCRQARRIGRPGEFPARSDGAEHGQEAAVTPPWVAVSRSAFRMIPRPRARPYHQGVKTVAARLAPLPPRRQELVQDLGLGVALAAVNVVSLLPYRAQLHPLWLALTLVAAQGIPLIWRRSYPIGIGLVIGAARVAYDKIGFG